MRNRLWLILLLLSVMLFSCAQDALDDDDNNVEQNVEMSFSLQVEEQEDVVAKSVSAQDEIISIDILIFDENDLFLSRERIDDIVYEDGVYIFKSYIESSASRRKLHFVANLRDASGTDRVDLSSWVVGVTPESQISTLQTDKLTTSTVSTIFPHIMWGKVTLDAISSGIRVTGVRLMRSVASVSVLVGPDVDAGIFQLSSVSVHNASAYGFVAPESILSSDALPTAPHLPSPIEYISYFNNDGSGFWQLAVDNQCKDLYIYENTGMDVDENAYVTTGLSFIIKAKYNNEDCYYRIAPDDGTTPFKYIRNHRYILNIVRVDGKGYASIDLALANPPSNIHIEIDDNSDRFTNVVSDGSNILGTTLTELSIYSNEFASIPIFDVLTNHELGDIDVRTLSLTNLRFDKSIISSGDTDEFRVFATSLTPVVGMETDDILLEDKKSGLTRYIPLVIDPGKSLVSLGEVVIVSPSDGFISWNATYSSDSPMLVELNGQAVDSYSCRGGASDELVVSYPPVVRSSASDHFYISVKGVKEDGDVVNAMFVIRYY